MQELKPCPFCGEAAELIEDRPTHARCSNELCAANYIFFLVGDWNARATTRESSQPDELSHAIKELQSYEKSADANPELYRDGWECAIQCAINVLHRHQTDSTKRESVNPWQPISTAPKTESVELLTANGEVITGVEWSERPVCMLGSRNGGFPAGWASDGSQCDRNLPMTERSDPPTHWRKVTDIEDQS